MAFGSSKSKSASKSPSSAHMSAAQQQLAAEMLAKELLMMQFLGGGSVDKNAKRVMEEQQQRANEMASAASRRASQPPSHDQYSRRWTTKGPAPHLEPMALGKSLRDEHGNTWWDDREGMEYVGTMKTQTPTRLAFDGTVSRTRRGSATVQSPLSPTLVIPASAMPGDAYHGYSTGRSSASSSLSSSPTSSGFEDAYASYPAPDARFGDVVSKKANKGLRGKARALFGGH